VSRASRVLPAAAVLLVAACGPGTAASGPAPAPASRSGTPGQVAAYVDVTLPGADLDLPDPGPRVALVLSFVTAAPRGCTPTWGGRLAVDDPAVLALARRWRAAGHELRVSFGGEQGTDLAQRCQDAGELTAAYRRVVDVLAPAALDLDVEGRALDDTASVHRRNLALRALQVDADRRGRPVLVTFTLPADSRGLTTGGRALLQDAHAAGVTVDGVNALTMNYGAVPADAAAQAMTVAASVHEVLRGLQPDADAAALWRRVWVTPMIGRNDVAPEVFTTADADRLAALARAQGLGGLAFWSLARDRPCADGTAAVSSTCSGVDAPAGAFGTALARFAAG
jgi:chitinase